MLYAVHSPLHDHMHCASRCGTFTCQLRQLGQMHLPHLLRAAWPMTLLIWIWIWIWQSAALGSWSWFRFRQHALLLLLLFLYPVTVAGGSQRVCDCSWKLWRLCKLRAYAICFRFESRVKLLGYIGGFNINSSKYLQIKYLPSTLSANLYVFHRVFL